MKSVKSVNFNILLRIFVLSLSLLLASCGNGYSPVAPGSQARGALAALDTSASTAIRTTDAKFAYVFSQNFIAYNPPASVGGSAKTFNSPVYSYSIDSTSGMPSLIGIESDSQPDNPKFIKVSPSDRHLYVLTGDNFIYTFAIGFSIFTVGEFKNQNLNPLALFNALSQAGYMTATASSVADMVNQLNIVLAQPDLSDQLFANKPNLTLTAEIIQLKTSTANLRTQPFAALAEGDQKSVIRLNRLMVELVYPNITPVNKGARVQHAVGTPTPPPPPPPPVPPSMLPLSWVNTESIEIDTFGKFVYALGSKIVGYSQDPVTGTWSPIINPAVAVYARDQATGILSFTDTQILNIGQLIFAPSGLFAFGSNNGSLQSYSVNQRTGLLTAVGAPFPFTGWVHGQDYNGPDYSATFPNFRNMATDQSGKFLYLIGSSGYPWTPPPNPGCDAVMTYHQLGSMIYTFIIDANSGLLTQAAPPIDTTPHIMTSISVDTKGRFVQLLNTHEYSGQIPPYTTACLGGITSPLNVGAIYTYYIEQATGKLIPTGSLQAGGAQLPTGFVAAGLDSVSLSGDATGRFLYLLNAGDMFVYNVDQANGALTAIGSPLTGATATAMPGTYSPVIWPSVCYTNSALNGYCTKLTGSRSHSLTWAGY